MEDNKISLTDFIESVKRTGTKKISLIHQIVNREGYSRKRDFYGIVRDFISKKIKSGNTDLTRQEINKMVEGVNPKKQNHYSTILKGYNKFLKLNPSTKLFIPSRYSWKCPELKISVNPEVGIESSGKMKLIKLHFKSERLKKESADIILTLMREACPSNFEVAILDVRSGKLHEYSPAFPHSSMMTLLKEEARTYSELLKELTTSRAA